MSKKLEEEFSSMKPGNFFIRNSYFLDHLYFKMKSRSAFHVRNYSYDVLESYKGETWEKQKNKIIEFKQICQNSNIKFAIVLFPFMQDIGAEYKHVDLHRAFGVFMKGKDIPFLDLFDVYEENKSEKLVLNSSDSHPSKAAHRIAANALLRFIKEIESSGNSAAMDK